MSTPLTNKQNDGRMLTNKDLSNWNNLERLSNSEAQSTMGRVFGWYGRYGEVYQRGEAPQEYDRFKQSAGELRGMYDQFNRDDVLDKRERGELRSAANRVDRDLTELIQRADLPTPAKAIVESGTSSSATAASSPEASKQQPTSGESRAEAKPDPGFEGRYQVTSARKLDELTAGKTAIGLGTKGSVVQEAQELMKKHGASFTKTDASGKVVKDYGADGFFGDVTKRELQKLQKQWGLPETGQLDAKSLEKLRETPKKQEGSSAGGGLEVRTDSGEGASPATKLALPEATETSVRGRSGRNKPKAQPRPQEPPLEPAPTPQTYLA